ncbi:hypothetical protein SAZ_14905 [Streptomyces noursei ZPM]|uniref:Uncharacterized protein n=1 Tax=Streptomyces noursei TaxID=1971 RepID=A0A401QZQ5_STRNR|nr:hypothetical protein [Streptomyces noursei]AKA08668.1 hypothetical protein SAZ_14905 [Streptomyces noursei ZPM]EPY93209.1 hypothetical protein K530_49265 [Streptomyces noursei CCRC 11814]UWS71982.1 hypothetical protein N1H47_12395 [Streptomyces noursei]GCB90860.1 hypothetical protein SALB_03568 [Streptomyces noursei]
MSEEFEKEAIAALDALSQHHMDQANQAAAKADDAQQQAAALRGEAA